jgi:hydroxypyruvate isomerase
MPRLAANLTLLYPELPFVDRFAAAAGDGFEAVECQFPYAVDRADLAARLRDQGLRQVLLNAPPGDWDAGERGLAALPGREAEFRRSFDTALAYAEALDCPRIHVMAGLVDGAVDRGRATACYVANLAWAAAQAADAGRSLTIEPINPRDMPGYFLQRQDDALDTLRAVGAANVQVQLDLYHCQIVEGDLTRRLREGLAGGHVGHLQVAGVPDRHEPDGGEIDVGWLFDEIDSLSAAHRWSGWVGLEYRPRGGAAPGATSAGLRWCARWLHPCIA